MAVACFHTNALRIVWSGVAGTMMLAAAVTVMGQIPGSGPGQIPGQGPGPGQGSPPSPFHIPHIGGSRQARPQPQGSSEGAVYVVLWFDVQDYLTPQADEAAKRLAVFLTQEGIPATFNIVGEKARELEQRQRQDVITAIGQHEIGYGSDLHSQNPTVAEFESNLEWDAGVKEFEDRERAGFDAVARIFRKTPVAYAQPGDAWAPEAFPALEKWGVRTYLGEGDQVELRGRPFWYGGLLNIFHIRGSGQLQPNAEWSNLSMAKARFQDTYLALTSRKTGGFISLHFSPAEFVDEQPWDEVNFRHGANPPPDQWKAPPVMTPQETENAFQYFEGLVRFLKSFPRVQFLTASVAAARLRDRARMHVLSSQEVSAIANQVDPNVTFQEGDSFNLSASEVFFVLNKYLAGIVNQKAAEPLFLERTPDGPASATPPLTSKFDVPWLPVRQAVLAVQDELDKTNRIPSGIRIGGQVVPPESYLVGIAKAVQTLLQNAQLPDTITFGPARLAAADYVADDSPDLWDWAIFPQGFHAPKMMSLAKLQAWTLKPAIQ